MRSSEATAPTLSVVVPLYNEETNVGALVDELVRVLDGLAIGYEIVLVDDGSGDGTGREIERASDRCGAVRGVSLWRNFGHQSALFAGLAHANGRAIVTMDGDLQHPPETIPQLITAWREGYKVVNTVRIDSPETGWAKRWTSRLFYRLFSRLSGLRLAPGSSDFRLLDAEVVGVILDMREPAVFLRGAVQWIGCPAAEVEFEARRRHSGETKFSLGKMLTLATDGLVSYSTIPLKLGIWLGLMTSLIALGEIGYIVVQYWRGATVPGWASVVTVISFMFAVLFILLGILGTYLAKIYEAVNGRPRYLSSRHAVDAKRKSKGRAA